MQDAPPLTHLHHIAGITADPNAAEGFYSDILGLRAVARAASFDDAEAYHMRFACDPDDQGGVVALYVWPYASHGRWGIGTTHHVAMLVSSADAQVRWKRRLQDNGIGVTGPYDRRYFRSIYFADPDGLILEIATRGPGFGAYDEPHGTPEDPLHPPVELTLGHRDEETIAAITWPDPVEEIDDEMRLRGLHHVTCVTGDDRGTDSFCTEVLGLPRVRWTLNFDAPDVTHTYYANAGADPGSTITFFGFTPKTMRPGRVGVGVVHHIAYACEGDDALEAWRARLRSADRNVTIASGRGPWRAISFDDPSGIHLEIVSVG